VFGIALALAALPTFNGMASAQAVDVVEYYNASQDHYFITGLPTEIGILDAGQPPGFVRTGYSFSAHLQPFGSASPVCRFYIPVGYGNSHFYSASPAECAIALSQYPWFVYESPNVMYVDDASTGACPAATCPCTGCGMRAPRTPIIAIRRMRRSARRW
jgi:hypothetical protein